MLMDEVLKLIPGPETSRIITQPHPVEGRFARRTCERGEVASAGRITQVLHSGGVGAPPGTTTSPCQELAEGSAGAWMRDRPD